MSILTSIVTLILFMQPVELEPSGLGAARTPPRFAATLLAANESLAPGEQTELLIEIEVGSPWHIYDPIILDTGLATRVKFTASQAVTIGELRFPPPALGEQAELEYLEHSGKIGVLTTLTLGADAKAGETLRLRADVSGLACKEMCLPVSATATLELPITATPGAARNQKEFEEARAALAPLLADAPYLKGSSVRVSKETLKIGEDAELIATIKVQAGHHIQDRNPGTENAFPARLFIEKLDGLEFAEEKDQIWPKPHTREVKDIGKVNEQAGEFEIRVPFKIADAAFAAGPRTLRVLFQYQTCTDAGQCYLPTMAAGFASFIADTPNPPLAESETNVRISPDLAIAASGGSATGASDASSGREPATSPAGADRFATMTPEQLAKYVPPFTKEAWAQHIPWIAWEKGLPEALSRAGHEVYVDFTATWCLTCQTNKKLVLDTAEIREKMRTMKVVPLEADFTKNDPVMQQELYAYGSLTVPLNLVYAAGKPETPGILPTLLTNSTVQRALDNPLVFVEREKHNFFAVILAGLLGGLILNVMPCVLPVISIKILSFVQQAGEDPKRVFRLGLAFCAGIMVWFWLFALISSSGGKLPLQSAKVVVGLSSLIFVFSLNLMGVFEVILPGSAAGKLDEFASREGYLGAFFKGFFATLLGTACIAPFLVTALGYTKTQPWYIGVIVFSSAGVGMSLPYLLLSANPAWLKFLPRPGMWMVTFKQVSGFVLLATAVWLLWILAAQIDGQGIVWTVAFWGFLALAVWMIGKIKATWETARRATMWASALAVAGFGFYFCYFVMYEWGKKL